MTLALIFLLSPVLAIAQTIIGIDLTSALHSELKISFGHRISEHWSVSADAGVNLKLLHRRISSQEVEHNSEFQINPMPEAWEHMHQESISMCFWHQRAFNGAFLSLGARYRDTDGLDGTAGLGYMFLIWKGLTGMIRYDTGLIRTSESGNRTKEGLSVSINWIF